MDPKLKILVIDDMPVMRKMVTKILTDLGYSDIEHAEDGAIALEKVKQAHSAGVGFQFIVSDWNMPNMTGLELLINLRADDSFKKLPFLMVTAEGEKGNIIKAVQAGVSDFVIKPFTKDILSQKINRVLGQ
jgi:two-component system chemotaxis response regulator CheY